MSGPSHSPLLSGISHRSNLLEYRALFQVFTYARVKRQSAEHLVRDAMTGGVVVPFCVLSNAEVTADDVSAASSSPTRASTPMLLSAQQPLPADKAREPAHTPLLLLPSSKSIATLASLLADGFFNLAPLSSTVERIRCTPFQFRSECEARDFFTLIALLFPDCFVDEGVPRALWAQRCVELAVMPTSASSRGGSEGATPTTLQPVSPANSFPASSTRPQGWRSPLVQGNRGNVDVAHKDEVTWAARPSPPLTVMVDAEDDSLVPSGGGLTPALPRPQSPSASAFTEFALSSAQAANTSGNSTAPAGYWMLPEVDPVPLTMEGTKDLLECRRSLATVLLSSLNEALHDVQYRELERGKPTVKGGAADAPSPSSCEAIALQMSSEFLLTAKMMLMVAMAASEVWWRRLRRSEGRAKTLPTITSADASPHSVLYELLEQDEAAAARFTKLPVEEWIWGKDKEATALWYDRLLDHLLQSTEAAGFQLDAFMRQSKSFASQQGKSVSHAPTLLLHRPSDGHPAVEWSLAFLDGLNCGVALPVMPLQMGELQLLLLPCVVRDTDSGPSIASRGHEFLFDSSASPTAEFLHSCASATCPAAMLQASGPHLPVPLRHRFCELSDSERGMVRNFLGDPQLLAGVLEKNAAMLARLTLWAEGQWPPAPAPSRTNHVQALRTVVAERDCVTSEDGYELAAGMKDTVLFVRPFNAAVGRFVREMVVLNGFDQMTLDRWIRHICTDIGQDGPSSQHRATLAALVKFAALQRRWTWTSEVGELQRQYLP